MSERYKQDIDLLLMEYACGTLDEALSMVIASYITIRPDAMKRVKNCESLGGALIEKHCSPEKMSRESLQKVLEQMDGERPAECTEPHQCCPKVEKFLGHYKVPLPISGQMQLCPKRKKWKRLAHGVYYHNVPTGNAGHKAFLIKAAPGRQIPHHAHTGREITLVLDGSFADENGTYNTGDIVVYGGSTEHQPVADKQTGCCCMLVMNGPIAYTKPVKKVMNVFMTIGFRTAR